MARKAWTEAEVKVLEQRIRDKVARKIKLTAGEDVVWGVIRNNKPLEVRFVEETDFLMGFDE